MELGPFCDGAIAKHVYPLLRYGADMNLNAYSPQLVVVSCLVVLIVMLMLFWGVQRQRSRRRTAELRARFGSEYDLAVRECGSQRLAEAALEARLRRVERLQLRPVSAADRDRLLRDWDTIQTRFLDHPRGAVTDAEDLIGAVLQARGYPGGRFEQRVADLSVNHVRLVDSYRRANAIAVRSARGEASTEELRTAMILYRAVFEEVLETKSVAMPRAEAA